MRFFNRNLIKIFSTFFFLIFIDQISKYLIRRNGGFYVCNSGISWGIELPGWFFFFLWPVLFLFLLILLIKSLKKSDFFVKITSFKSKVETYALLAILSGASSNLIDRIVFGCVFDFIDLNFWPVFNLADIFITMGTAIIVVRIFKM